MDWESKGLNYATINYDKPSILVNAFRGAEVAISTIGFRALEQQRYLARAAKEAGVKIFVPSEYGGETHEVEEGVYFLAKKGIHKYLEEIKLPYTLFYTGPSPDFFLTSYVYAPHGRSSLFSNLLNPASLGGIFPAVKSPTALVTNLRHSLRVRTSRGSSVMHSRNSLPLSWNGLLSVWKESVL